MRNDITVNYEVSYGQQDGFVMNVRVDGLGVIKRNIYFSGMTALRHEMYETFHNLKKEDYSHIRVFARLSKDGVVFESLIFHSTGEHPGPNSLVSD